VVKTAPAFRWLIATLLFLACGLSFFDRQVLSVLAPTITAELKMNNVAYSWVVFAFILSYSVMFTAGGWLIDRLGTRVGMALSVAVWSAASLLHALSHNAWQLGLFRLLLGVGEGGCFPGAAKGVLEWFPKKERAIAMGFATSGGSAIGAVVAPPAIVWTITRTGWRGAFVLTGVIGAVWLVFWLLTYSRPPHAFEEESAAAASVISWRELLSCRDVQGLVSSRFFFDPVFYFYMFWIPQYLSQVRGASLERIGQLTWIPFLTLGVSSVFGGWISDRLVRSGVPVANARKYVIVASALLTPVSIMAVFVYTIETAIALMSVLMFAHGFWITNYMTVIGDLFPGNAVGTVVGLTGTAGGIGGFITSLLIGRVVQSISYTPVFIAAGMVYPLCALILLTTVTHREISSPLGCRPPKT
jgi:ACS family hexuronate transporter-like MFS transporter